jgi:hydrogenase-4 component E
MAQAETLLLLLVLLTGFAVLGTARLSAGINALRWQGLWLGLLPPVLHRDWTPHLLLLAVGTIVVKCVVLPRFLLWAIREASVRREEAPVVGYVGSLLLGAVGVAIGFAVGERLPLTHLPVRLLVPTALATIIFGLIVLTSRRKALSQVVGYLMLENGIYLFGVTEAARAPVLVELGILLDVFVGVFIMGIVVFHIGREFDSIDSAQLAELAE